MSAPAGRPRSVRGIVTGASLALCLAGVFSLGQGAAVPVKAEMAQRRLERTFEQRLTTEIAAPGRTLESVARGYSPRRAGETARVLPALQTDGPVARISVERLGVSDAVLAGNGTHEQLAEAPTIIRRSDGVTILAAHRDTHFLFIRDLREGDEVAMQFVDGAVERYRVRRFETVRWDRFAYPLDPARPLLALVTCYPFGGTEYGGPWRRIAWAERIG